MNFIINDPNNNIAADAITSLINCSTPVKTSPCGSKYLFANTNIPTKPNRNPNKIPENISIPSKSIYLDNNPTAISNVPNPIVIAINFAAGSIISMVDLICAASTLPSIALISATEPLIPLICCETLAKFTRISPSLLRFLNISFNAPPSLVISAKSSKASCVSEDNLKLLIAFITSAKPLPSILMADDAAFEVDGVPPDTAASFFVFSAISSNNLRIPFLDFPGPFDFISFICESDC